MAGRALLDLEELVEAQSILVSSQALLVQLELPQSFVLLVASGAGVLHQVEAGLGGVVAQRAVVDTRFWAVCAILLVQVLWRRAEASAAVRGYSHFLGPSIHFKTLRVSFKHLIMVMWSVMSYLGEYL